MFTGPDAPLARRVRARCASVSGMPHKHFDCPHCDAPVPVELEELMAAGAVLTCPGCRQPVIVTAGKLSNHQPGAAPSAQTYDSGD